MVLVNYAYREHTFLICDVSTRQTGFLAKQIILFDMNGSSITDMMNRRQSSIHKEVSSASSYLYPQLVDKMCMINAPSWMTYVVSFFRKILPKKNMDKIGLFKNTSNFWNTKWVQSTFNRKEVPIFLGGLLSDDKISNKLKGKLLVTKDQDVMTSITVYARTIETVQFDVPFKNAKIILTLCIASYGIDVSIIHESNSDSVTIRPGGKIKAENGTQKIEWSCKEPGTATITFNNSYSILRSKTIQYRFEIIE